MAANQNKKLGELVGDPLATRGSRSVEAWFLGSRAENLEEFERLIVEAVRDHGFWRRNFHPGDPSYITEKVKRSPEYLDAVENTRDSFRELLAWLKKSVPFFSLRYQGHMTWETTIPSMLGYFSTMLYNPNNVAFEASTVTTLLEMHVGDDLCRMLGYHLPTEDEQAAGAIAPWGHITSGGTVANLEGLWAARNLKFYAFTLKEVIRTELKAGENIEVPLSDGTKKKLVLMTTWELLNLRADDILAIPSRLNKEYGISEAVVKKVLEETEYTVQKLGMTEFAQHFLKDIKQPVFFVPGTKHYSWPKSAAILGIGSKHMIDVPIDVDARMDLHELENHLNKCLQEHTPVFAVIAVIGSTEESSIDPLADIVTLREKFRKKGLNFSIHADAAWGGYHACLLTRTTTKSDLNASVPVGLSTFSTKHMLALADTDSITVDPHKSGYIPYPAGAVCYRNGTMRNLLTFIAPYVNTGKEQPNVGSFGVEGSKPGAAVAAVYLSHKVIRPDVTGYGQIIGRAMFGSKKLYARLLCMARPEDRFVVVPVPRLSSAIPGKEEKDKIHYVRERIDKKSNSEISQDKEALDVLKEIGPDQNILCYAFNFKNIDGTLNKDLAKANKLNELLYEILSINAGSDIYAYDLLVSTTAFEVEHYSEPFMKDYANRMGLDYTDRKSIKVLRSTVMDPWISEAKGRPFIDIIEDEFRNALAKALSKLALLNLFQSVDTNADGRIDKTEVRKHLLHLGYSNQEIENIWKQSDTNHDNSLSSDEFIKNVASFLVTRQN